MKNPRSASGISDPENTEIASHDIATISGDIATPVKQGAKRMHKATYARDKRKGGYLVRVVGPHATAFGKKIVPVVRRDDSETEEALEVVVWSGIDTGTPDNPGTGKPVALYTFAKKPEGSDEVEF